MTLIIWNLKSIYWVLLGFQRICCIWLTDYQSPNTPVTITKCESRKRCSADGLMKDPKCCQISTTVNMEVKKCFTRILINGQSMLIRAVPMVVLVLLVTWVPLMAAFKIQSISPRRIKTSRKIVKSEESNKVLMACSIHMVHQHRIIMLRKLIIKIKWLNNKISKKDKQYVKVVNSRSWIKMLILKNRKTQRQAQSKPKVNQEVPNSRLVLKRESRSLVIIRIKINQLMCRTSKIKIWINNHQSNLHKEVVIRKESN